MLFIIIIYILSFGLSLLNRGVYWDDWAVIVGKSPAFIQMVIGGEMGNIVNAHLLSAMSVFNSAIIPRVITFFIYGLSGYFFYSILGSIKFVDKKLRLLLTIFFLLFPANDSRVVLTIMFYSFSHFLFYFAWWFLCLYYRYSKLSFRILSLILFFVSFNVNSLLFFYVIVLAYIFYKEKFTIRRNIDYVLLPFLYFFLKMTLFTPSGEYAGYNVITLPNVFSALYRSLGAYIWSFGLVFLSSLYSLFNISLVNIIWTAGTNLNLHPYVTPLTVSAGIDYMVHGAALTWEALYQENTILQLLYVIIATSSVYICIKKQRVFTYTVKRMDTVLFFFGCIFFYLAVYPYYVVHKLPSVIEGFSDRHLLLVPLGASFMIVYGVKMLANIHKSRPVLAVAVYAVCIVMFINYHIRINIEFLKDWYKQVAVMEEMRNSPELRDHTTFLFSDNAIDLNVMHSPYPFYEYTGLMKMAFGDEIRFGSNINEFVTYNNTLDAPAEIRYQFSANSLFKNAVNESNNLKDYVLKNPEYIIEIDKGTFALSDMHLVYLLYSEYFNKKAYDASSRNIVTLRAVPLP